MGIIIENWDRLMLIITSILGNGGWLWERGKRMRDNRSADLEFWQKTIDAQNNQIESLRKSIETLESQNKHMRDKLNAMERDEIQKAGRISSMEKEILDLQSKLERYEPKKPRPTKSNIS